MPDEQGYDTHNTAKGLINISQASGDTFSLALTSAGHIQIGHRSANVSETIAGVVPDPTDWLECWMTFELVQSNDYRVALYLNGESHPHYIAMLPAAQPGDNSAGGVFTRDEVVNYLAIGMSSTAQTGNFDLDYIAFKDALVAPRTPERILFTSESVGGSPQLFTLREDGTDLQQLTNTGGTEFAPAISPNGQWIAFIDTSNAPNEIYLTDFNGRIPIPINNGENASAVQWIDNETLAYIAPSGGFPFQFKTIHTNSTGLANLFTDNRSYNNFATGQDSFEVIAPNRILFTAFSGSTPPALLSTAAFPSSVFNAPFTSCTDPFSAPALLRDHYDLTKNPHDDRIAYAADEGRGSHRIYVRDSTAGCGSQILVSGDTTAADNAFASGVFCGDPDWSASGEWLTFTRASGSTFGGSSYVGDLWRVGADGSNLINLTGGLTLIAAGRCAHAEIYSPVHTPATITDIAYADDAVSLRWTSIADEQYDVVASPDKSALPEVTNWRVLTNNVASQGLETSITLPVSTNAVWHSFRIRN